MQRKCRDLTAEKEGLETALQLSNECQNELSIDLIELKEKYDLLLKAFHELKEELRRNKNDSLRYLMNENYETDNEDSLAALHFIPISESLQAEIESTLESEGYGSEFSSLNTTILNQKENQQLSNLDANAKSLSPDNLITDDKICDSPNCSSRQAASRCGSNDNSISTCSTVRAFSIPNKLKMVKPLEGSETLGKWKKLATPHLGVILESHSGVQNRVLQGVDKDLVDYALKKDSPEEDVELISIDENKKRFNNNNNHNYNYHNRNRNLDKNKNKINVDRFGTTLSVYTFTTTSLSQNADITSVTPSLSTQLATGLNLPITSISSSPITLNSNSLTATTQQKNENVNI